MEPALEIHKIQRNQSQAISAATKEVTAPRRLFEITYLRQNELGRAHEVRDTGHLQCRETEQGQNGRGQRQRSEVIIRSRSVRVRERNYVRAEAETNDREQADRAKRDGARQRQHFVEIDHRVTGGRNERKWALKKSRMG